jgi:hypothetical protein
MKTDHSVIYIKTTKYLHIQSTEQCMSGVFQTIDPPPPLHPASVSSLRTKGGGEHTRRAVRGWGVNSLEDARHWIGLLQYNPSTIKTIHPSELSCSIYTQLQTEMKRKARKFSAGKGFQQPVVSIIKHNIFKALIFGENATVLLSDN